jgi:hypothetical protein
MKPAAPVVRPLARISVLVIVPLLIALGASTAAGAVNSTVARPSNAKHQPARPTLKTAAPRAPQTTTTTTTTGKPAAALSRTPATAILLSHIAHTYTVRKLNDLSNGTTCGVNCTLRNAINKANATPGVDLITFAKIGTITLNTTYGSLNPTTSMVIQGLGPAKTVVSGLGCTCGLFDIEYGTNRPTVEIDGMKMTKGSGESGGGVYVGSAAVILDHDVITDNKVGASYYGGGVYVGNTDSQFWLTNSTVSANNANYGGGIWFNYGAAVLSNDWIGGTKAAQGNEALSGYGGGIYNDDGVISAYNTHVDHNRSDTTSGAYGGGIYNCCYTLSMQGGSVSNNVVNAGTGSGYGGGLYLDSSGYSVQLDGVHVDGNRIVGTYGEGGGIYNSSYLQMTGSTASGNAITLTADNDSGYGAGISDESQLQMIGGSISSNIIQRGGAATYINAYGAGFYEDDWATFNGVTIKGNKALAGANGYAYGGGGYGDYSDLFRNVVVSGNHANGYDAYGAGLYLDTGYEAHVSHGTFSGNVNSATNYAEGAAIDQEGDDLALNDVSIVGSTNTVSAGGGIYAGAVYCYYECTWDHVAISKTTNTATGTSGPYVYGGAMYSYDVLKWSGVTIASTTNTTHGPGGYIYGGGAYFDGSSSYADEVSGLNVHATKNSASGSGYIYGGVLYETNYLQLNGATFSATTNAAGGNGAYIYGGVGYLYYQSNFTRVKAIGTIDKLPGDGTYAQGGAFNFYDYVTAVNMSVVGTTVTLGLNGYGYGGAIYDDYASSFDRLTVAGTTFSATGALSYLYGGGMYLDSTINVVNSTIAGNHITSPATASGYGGFGGGVYMDDAVTFTNDTIAGNTAGPGRGGGIYDDGYLQTFRNTIVSGNAGRNCATNTGSTLLSAGHNLEKGTTCHFNQAGDLNTVASLGLLKNNGGFAATMMPKPGSPAINHAGNGGCPAVDERGVARPQHRICDIGAVEVK